MEKIAHQFTRPPKHQRDSRVRCLDAWTPLVSLCSAAAPLPLCFKAATIQYNRMMMDINDVCCGRKRRAVDDPFFTRCNRIALQRDEVVFYIEERHHENAVKQMDAKKTDSETTPLHWYPCCVPGCIKTFQTIAECEEHFDQEHLFQCGECHVVLPCNHLLELHLQEEHDSFFTASVEHHQASFACLVESCSETFSSPQKRRQHLQSHHDYPKWFRFTTTTPEQRKVLKKKTKWLHNHHKHSLPPTNDGHMHVDMSEPKKKRRELQKKKRATIPCRYFRSKEGCWRGDSCMFLHCNKSDDDVHVNSLVDDMQHKAKVSVPDKICFGRRRKGPY